LRFIERKGILGNTLQSMGEKEDVHIG